MDIKLWGKLCLHFVDQGAVKNIGTGPLTRRWQPYLDRHEISPGSTRGGFSGYIIPGPRIKKSVLGAEGRELEISWDILLVYDV